MNICEGHNVKGTTGNSLAAIVQKFLHIKHVTFFFSPAFHTSPNSHLTLLIWPVRLLHLHLLW